MTRLLTLICLGLLLLPARAQPTDEKLHEALRKLRDQATAAVNAGDFEGLARVMDERIVFTAMNAEVCHGPQEVKAYFDRMLKGPDPVVKQMQITKVDVDRLTDLYNNGTTGVASGTCTGDYTLKGGLKFSIVNRWSSTLVRQGDDWKIAAIHFSSNVFDNPVLDQTKQMMMLVGAASVVVALLAGVFLGRWSKR